MKKGHEFTTLVTLGDAMYASMEELINLFCWRVLTENLFVMAMIQGMLRAFASFKRRERAGCGGGEEGLDKIG